MRLTRCCWVADKYTKENAFMEKIRLNDKFTGDEFPGYENVRLSYAQLKTIIDRKLPAWMITTY